MTPAQVALNQRQIDQAYGTSGLAESFQAMVDELRPKWDAAEAKRQAGRAAWWAARRIERPAPPPLTVDDYRARLARFDSTAYLSDDREVANAGSHEHARLTSMARQFDPDFAIWHEIVNGGVRK